MEECMHNHTKWVGKSVWVCINCGEITGNKDDIASLEEQIKRVRDPIMRQVAAAFHEFKPYVLKDGDFSRLDPGDFGRDGKVHIETQAQEDSVLKKINCHKMEPKEKVMGITMECKEPPKRKIYSFLKG